MNLNGGRDSFSETALYQHEIRSRAAMVQPHPADHDQNTLEQWRFITRYDAKSIVDIGGRGTAFASVAGHWIPGLQLLSLVDPIQPDHGNNRAADELMFQVRACSDVPDSVGQQLTVRDLEKCIPTSRPLFFRVDSEEKAIESIQAFARTIKDALAVSVVVRAQNGPAGRSSFDDLFDLMRSYGFRYCGNVNQWISRRCGETLLCDCLFESINGVT